MDASFVLSCSSRSLQPIQPIHTTPRRHPQSQSPEGMDNQISFDGRQIQISLAERPAVAHHFAYSIAVPIEIPLLVLAGRHALADPCNSCSIKCRILILYILEARQLRAEDIIVTGPRWVDSQAWQNHGGFHCCFFEVCFSQKSGG